MLNPKTGNKAILQRKLLQREFRGEAFEVWEHYFEDEQTGETFSLEAQDELSVTQVYNLYRARHHIPFPDEIRSIRDQYGLSASKMSEVLDLGINSYRNYEKGEIPSLANAKLIRLAKDPGNFLSFVAEKEEIFSPNGYKKVTARIQELMKPSDLEAMVEYIWNHHMEANAYTGFVKPSFEKVAHCVIFFAEKLQPLKTKLNKLLFYCDFLHFKQTGFAISGCNYRAIQLGPVPSHFSELFGLLEDQGFVSVDHEVLERGVGERFLPEQNFDPGLFSQEELTTMSRVAEAFRDIKTTEIVTLSHEEKAWLMNQEKRALIDYQKFGFELKGV